MQVWARHAISARSRSIVGASLVLDPASWVARSRNARDGDRSGL